MTHTDPIKALVDLEPELQRKLRTDHNICLFSDELKVILAAIEALTPIAEGTSVVVPAEPTMEMIEAGESAFFTTYTGTATSSPDLVWKAMVAAASPSASTGKNGVVERVAAAILEAGLWKGAWVQANETEMNDARHKARAALAAIGER